MKIDLGQVVGELQQLLSRMRSRENAANTLHYQVTQIKTQLQTMRQYQEDVISFSELSRRLSTHTNGQRMLCLAVENKQLEQLRGENHVLRRWLKEYQVALDIIMSKYREQISSLMRTHQMESAVQNSPAAVAAPSKPTAAAADVSSDSQGDQGVAWSDVNTLSDHLATLVTLTRDVSARGDAYTAELEKELKRLRVENDGLRELLNISSAQTEAAGQNGAVAEYMQDLSWDLANNIAAAEPVMTAKNVHQRLHSSTSESSSYTYEADKDHNLTADDDDNDDEMIIHDDPS